VKKNLLCLLLALALAMSNFALYGAAKAEGTYTVTFRETDLPNGVEWSVTFGGETKSTTNTSISFNVEAGTYSWYASTPIYVGDGVRYVASASSGSISVPSRTSQTIRFTKQYRLIIDVTLPEAGTTDPVPGEYWYDAGENVTVSASVLEPFRVEVSPYNLPDGVSMTVNPSEGTPDFTVTLKVSASPDITPGTYQIGTHKKLIGFRFTHWTLDGEEAGSENPIVVAVNQPHALKAWIGKPNIRRWFSVTSFSMYRGETRTITETIEEGEMQYIRPMVTGVYNKDLWLTIKVANVKIQVQDHLGKPLSGVTVTLGGQSKKTDSNGRAVFTVQPGKYTVTVPNSIGGRDFYKWSDGVTKASRTDEKTKIEISGDATFTAEYNALLRIDNFEAYVTCATGFVKTSDGKQLSGIDVKVKLHLVSWILGPRTITMTTTSGNTRYRTTDPGMFYATHGDITAELWRLDYAEAWVTSPGYQSKKVVYGVARANGSEENQVRIKALPNTSVSALVTIAITASAILFVIICAKAEKKSRS